MIIGDSDSDSEPHPKRRLRRADGNDLGDATTNTQSDQSPPTRQPKARECTRRQTVAACVRTGHPSREVSRRKCARASLWRARHHLPLSHLLAAPGVPSKPNHLEAPLEKTKPAQPSEAAQVCLFFEFFFLIYNFSELVTYHFFLHRATLTCTR
jgi:hypothetical protein